MLAFAASILVLVSAFYNDLVRKREQKLQREREILATKIMLPETLFYLLAAYKELGELLATIEDNNSEKIKEAADNLQLPNWVAEILVDTVRNSDIDDGELIRKTMSNMQILRARLSSLELNSYNLIGRLYETTVVSAQLISILQYARNHTASINEITADNVKHQLSSILSTKASDKPIYLGVLKRIDDANSFNF
ncbi:hypothetical protein ACED51_15580 [Photobacterium swingsii]|uniref:hypothetical protein n=1 Tax=Photobacterium swingsii TaxID=680026 RepID=UPI00352F2D20